MLSLKNKRKLDHFLGIFLANLFELIAFIAGKVTRREHKEVPFERILIVKFQGMGSLVSAYPAMLSLKKTNPEARILFWGTAPTVAMAKELNLFDDFVVLNDSTMLSAGLSILGNITRLLLFKPQWTFDLEIYSKLSSVLSLWTMSTNRVGFVSDTTKFRSYLHTHLIFFNRFRYVGDLYSSMFGECMPEDRPRPKIEDKEIAEELRISNSDEEEPYVVININTGELAPIRKWPEEKFRELVGLILDKTEYNIKLTGSGSERTDVERFLKLIEHKSIDRVENLAGKESLKELMQTIGNAKLMITNDSGPMHLGTLLSTPMVALFGPTHPYHFLPYDRDNIVFLYKNYICSPCVHVLDTLPCGGVAPCMDAIEVEEVYSAMSEAVEPTKKKRPEFMAPGSAKLYVRT
ncbi:MAG: glycosyltransferase family 9 protein [Proteobacteria bacterium]|nr:glycosyltransferase family 9 protein [Pseudomonadota bacterium]